MHFSPLRNPHLVDILSGWKSPLLADLRLPCLHLVPGLEFRVPRDGRGFEALHEVDAEVTDGTGGHATFAHATVVLASKLEVHLGFGLGVGLVVGVGVGAVVG